LTAGLGSGSAGKCSLRRGVGVPSEAGVQEFDLDAKKYNWNEHRNAVGFSLMEEFAHPFYCYFPYLF